MRRNGCDYRACRLIDFQAHTHALLNTLGALEIDIVIPDMGSLREELRYLLSCMSERARSKDLQLFFDMQKDLVAERSSFADIRARIVDGSQFHAVIGRAIERGEIDPARLTPRIVSLPLDLARHEMIMTFQPLSDDAIREIVDGIFLPLVRRDEPTSLM
ncbi:TetR-like C-terminal domain-containing protein [Gluconobacter sp. P1C6_b]|uniref:TetR-like C-terminal domain-containing protein n=1 Tax=Gluconobacter sp. P1C6_b TaxID=2762619 RepID=UPI0035302C78